MKVFFNDEMHLKDRSLPPGAWKARYLMNMIAADGPEMVSDFEPVSVDLLRKVHDPLMVELIELGVKANGYGTKQPQHFRKILMDNGSLISACEKAIVSRECILSPTSGFHHAGFSRVSGYCTFNGIIAAVMRIQELYPKARITIVDGDAHWGDGVHELLIHHRLLNVSYLSQSAYNSTEALVRDFDRVLDGTHVVIYQAGADAYIDDLLGSGTLEKSELYERDYQIFSRAKQAGAGVVWNLAGGYGAPTVKETMMLHYQTWRVSREIFQVN